MGRAERITLKIRDHDYKLYCKRMEGKLCIFRESQRIESYLLDEGTVIHSVRPAPHFIMALTDNWQMKGQEVDWGIEPIMARLKAMDLWHRDIVSDIEAQEEKFAKASERKMKTDNEAFLYDFRDKFKKTFNDVNTANLSKKHKEKRSFK